MIKLIDGKGGLGRALKKRLKYYKHLDCIIYHTWNLHDKSIQGQWNEFDKCIKKTCDYKKKKIVFISTLNDNWSSYLKYKYETEKWILGTSEISKVIRIPSIISDMGIFKRCLKNKPTNGKIEISTYDIIAEKILQSIDNNKRLEFIHGDMIEASTIYELIKYGSSNVGRK